ncbi:hypothetical protein GEMRC1_009004 [Eukaryota sp. GEM-RC1]
MSRPFLQQLSDVQPPSHLKKSLSTKLNHSSTTVSLAHADDKSTDHISTVSSIPMESFLHLIKVPSSFSPEQTSQLLTKVSKKVDKIKRDVSRKWKARQSKLNQRHLFSNESNSIRASAGFSLELSQSINIDAITRACVQEIVSKSDSPEPSSPKKTTIILPSDTATLPTVHFNTSHYTDPQLRAAVKKDLQLLVATPNAESPRESEAIESSSVSEDSGLDHDLEFFDEEDEEMMTLPASRFSSPSPPPSTVTRTRSESHIYLDNSFRPSITIYPHDQVPSTLPVPPPSAPPVACKVNPHGSLLPSFLPTDFTKYGRDANLADRHPEDVFFFDQRKSSEVTNVSNFNEQSILNQAASQSFGLPSSKSVQRMAKSLIDYDEDLIGKAIMQEIETNYDVNNSIGDLYVHESHQEFPFIGDSSTTPVEKSLKIYKGEVKSSPLNKMNLSPESTTRNHVIDELSQRFDDVMTVLAMPLLQKIDLMIKYTTTEFVFRLKEAVVLWEMASVSITQRERLLSEKDVSQQIAKDSSVINDKLSCYIQELEERLLKSTREVEHVLVKLYVEFGDIVTLKGVNYFDVADIDMPRVIKEYHSQHD